MGRKFKNVKENIENTNTFYNFYKSPIIIKIFIVTFSCYSLLFLIPFFLGNININIATSIRSFTPSSLAELLSAAIGIIFGFYWERTDNSKIARAQRECRNSGFLLSYIDRENKLIARCF